MLFVTKLHISNMTGIKNTGEKQPRIAIVFQNWRKCHRIHFKSSKSSIQGGADKSSPCKQSAEKHSLVIDDLKVAPCSINTSCAL